MKKETKPIKKVTCYNQQCKKKEHKKYEVCEYDYNSQCRTCEKPMQHGEAKWTKARFGGVYCKEHAPKPKVAIRQKDDPIVCVCAHSKYHHDYTDDGFTNCTECDVCDKYEEMIV